MTDPATLVHIAPVHTHGGLSDHALLERFAADRDEVAFTALVERHSSVVLDAARAVLRHEQDAEDVFQAAFLVLARKAAAIRKQDALACWLHGVAHRIALRSLRSRTRRTRHESGARVEPASGDDLTWREVRALVHDELARLPEPLRAPVILCHLEGLTLDEAANRLGLPRGTLRGRLDRARELLRRRLARRGLAASALAFPASLASAVPPLIVIHTARSATRFAEGFGEPTPASALANGAMSMTATRVKIFLLLVASLGAVGLGIASNRQPNTPVADTTLTAEPAPRDVGRPDPPAVPPVAEVAKVEFTEVTVNIKPGGLSNRTPEMVRITADGKCVYVVDGRPARGNTPAWSGASILHKLPPERLRELNAILKETDWLAKDVKDVMQLHHSEYAFTLKRDGKTTQITVKGESKPYAKLLYYFQSLSAQEDIVYRLDWVPDAHAMARVELDSLISGELNPPFARSHWAIDLNRFAPWATRIVRNSFSEQTDDVRSAVHLIGLLKLESERDFVADLAADRDLNVRVAVAQALGRLGGERSIPVLRKMIRSTGQEAPWELIKLGDIAVPTIVEVIRDGTDPTDRSYEWLIRAYIDHWKEVPRPLDPKILDAVRVSMAAPKVKVDRISYHTELLKLAAGPPGPDHPKMQLARVDVRNLAFAAEAYKIKHGSYPVTLAAIQAAGFVDPTAVLRDPWGVDYQYDSKGKRSGGTRADVWTVTPAKAVIGSWAADLWGVWIVQSAAAEEKTQRPSGGHWEFGVDTLGMFKSNNVFHRASRFTVDASKEPRQIDLTLGESTLKGIYEVKGDTLRVCHVLDPLAARPQNFEGGPGIVVWVFERQKE